MTRDRGEVERVPWAPLGRISVRAACEEIIGRLAAKDGIATAQAVDDVEELCGYRHEAATVQQAMLHASEALIRRGVAGVSTESGGWQRMDDTALIGHARRRSEKARRQVVKTVAAAEAADPEKLGWADRATRDHLVRLRELERVTRLRRTRKLRPLDPPAESA